MLNFTRKTYLLYFQETEHDIERTKNTN